LQNKFEISLTSLKVKYLEKIGFDIDEYLYIKDYNSWNKENLEEKYQKFLHDKKIN
jgi:hypothetical protein